MRQVQNEAVRHALLSTLCSFPFMALALMTASATAAPPAIDYNPRNQEVILYQPAALGVLVSGTPPFAYQWRKDGAPINGATNDQVLLARAQFSDVGVYSVVVSNAEGTVTSADAILLVHPPAGGDVDCSFACGGSINGGVASMAVQPDGKVVIGGNFSTVNGAARGRVARLNSDGSTDHTFMNRLEGVSGYGYVTSVALQQDGKVLIGGNFGAVNGVTRVAIARLNRDGSLDAQFQNGLSGVSGWVNAVAVQSDGKVLLGGYFYQVNGVNRKSLARLNPDGTLDTAFLNGLSGINELANGIAGTIHAIAVQSDGRILVAGVYYSVNGERRGNIARLNQNGTLDPGFLNQLSGADAWVTALAVQSDGKIVIGGPFIWVNGVSRSGIARLNADGGLDEDFMYGLPGISSADDPRFPITSRSVYSLALQTDGKILLGGRFTAVNGKARTNVARLNGDGTLDDGFKEPAWNSFSSVSSVSLRGNGKVLIGGGFERIGGESRHNIAQLNIDGSLDEAFHDGLTQAIYGVNSAAVQSDGKVIIVGQFVAINGIARSNIARLDADGGLDDGFQNGLSGANAPVDCVTLQPDGRLLIGGAFSLINGEGRRGIARLNADGTLDTTFQNGLEGVNGRVLQIAIQHDGKVLIQGQFTMVNGESRTNFARLNADGTLDSGFQNGLTTEDTDPDCPDATVHSIAVQSDDKVLIAGGFTSINGVSLTNLARFNSDGTLDTGFRVDFAGIGGSICPNPHGGIFSMAVQKDDRILIAGDFSAVNGASRNDIARLHADGKLDRGFMEGRAGTDGYINSVAVQSDGRILVGGNFSSINGVNRKSLARLNRDGTVDEGFQKGFSGPDGSVYWVAPQGDGKVFISRGFTSFNGVPVFEVVRIWYPLEIRTVSQNHGDVTLTWSAISNRTYRVQYKEDPAATSWTDLPGDVLATGTTASKTDTTRTGVTRFYQVVFVH